MSPGTQAGAEVAYASRTDCPEWANEALTMMHVCPGVTLHDAAAYAEAWGGGGFSPSSNQNRSFNRGVQSHSCIPSGCPIAFVHFDRPARGFY